MPEPTPQSELVELPTITVEPTAVPTSVPTAQPTAIPTSVPTAQPTEVPTSVPTAQPTEVPTSVPTAQPIEDIEPYVEEVRDGYVTKYWYGDNYDFSLENLYQHSHDSFDSVRNYFVDPENYPMEPGKATYINFGFAFTGDDKIFIDHFSETRNFLEEKRYQIAENQNNPEALNIAIEDFKTYLKDANLDNILRIANGYGVYTNDGGVERYIYFDDLSTEAKDLVINLAVDMYSPLLTDTIEYEHDDVIDTITSDDVFQTLQDKYYSYHSEKSK